MSDYAPLLARPLGRRGRCALAHPVPARVTMESPALEVMTDLSRVTAVSVAPNATVADANSYMFARGVRSLFVVAAEEVAGLITATDILGERSMRISQERGIPRRELVVADVMTPLHSLEAFALWDVRMAKVGHIVASLQRISRHHALVAEMLPDGGERIAGIFSASEIARQLGHPVPISERAMSFAELERALAHE
jgi:CBS domain-containing protein